MLKIQSHMDSLDFSLFHDHKHDADDCAQLIPFVYPGREKFVRSHMRKSTPFSTVKWPSLILWLYEFILIIATIWII